MRMSDEIFRKRADEENGCIVSVVSPELLDRVTDHVLAYRPKPKSKAAKKRARKKRKEKGLMYIIPFYLI